MCLCDYDLVSICTCTFLYDFVYVCVYLCICLCLNLWFCICLYLSTWLMLCCVLGDVVDASAGQACGLCNCYRSGTQRTRICRSHIQIRQHRNTVSRIGLILMKIITHNHISKSSCPIYTNATGLPPNVDILGHQRRVHSAVWCKRTLLEMEVEFLSTLSSLSSSVST